MTWTKLSDDFNDDCWELSDGAYRLHIEALVWSNRKLLDCRISKSGISRWAKNPDPEFVSELLDCGWWEDDGETYVVIHHSGYQRTREQVLRQQDANRNAGKKSGRERARRRNNSLNDSLNEVSNERDSDPPRTATGNSARAPRKPRTVNTSLNETMNERDGTGRDGPGLRNRGTEPSNGHRENSPPADEEYAASLREWHEEGP